MIVDNFSDRIERIGVPRGSGVALVLIRVIQNATMYLVALYYFRRLNIPGTLLGIKYWSEKSLANKKTGHDMGKTGVNDY